MIPIKYAILLQEHILNISYDCISKIERAYNSAVDFYMGLDGGYGIHYSLKI